MGASAGALMADLGATVIKIEPPGGEVMRGVIPTGAPGNMPFDFLFELENRGVIERHPGGLVSRRAG